MGLYNINTYIAFSLLSLNPFFSFLVPFFSVPACRFRCAITKSVVELAKFSMKIRGHTLH